MGGSSNNRDTSFIPKRGPANRSRRSGSKQVYVFTLVAYVLFFATLVATVGVFLYDRYIDQQLTNEVAALNEEINLFREADLEQVRLFNDRITFASERVSAASSLGILFSAIEAATAETVQLTTLDLERVDDNYYAVALNVETETLDSSIFQRELLEQVSTFDIAVIDEISIVSESIESEAVNQESFVSYVATLGVPQAAVDFVPAANITTPAPAFNEIEATSTEEVVTSETNETDL